VSISPHVHIHKSDRHYQALVADWAKFSAWDNGGEREYAVWYHICSQRPQDCYGDLAVLIMEGNGSEPLCISDCGEMSWDNVTGVARGFSSPILLSSVAGTDAMQIESLFTPGSLTSAPTQDVQDLASSTCSFAPDTPVLMADGTRKPIGAVSPGDTVEAADPATGKAGGGRKVLVKWVNHDTDLFDVTVDDGAGHRSVLRTTANHLFYDDTVKGFVRADRLVAGHRLASTAGNRPVVAAVRAVAGPGERDNLTVGEFHTYYVVAGDVPVLVHNCDMGALARAAAALAPKDATMSSVARFKGTDLTAVGYSGPGSRPDYFEPEVASVLPEGGQTYNCDASNCAEIRSTNSLFAEQAAEFEARTGREPTLADVEFLTVRSATGAPEAACLSCQATLVKGGATDLSRDISEIPPVEIPDP
jgi:hypothetical protein